MQLGFVDIQKPPPRERRNHVSGFAALGAVRPSTDSTKLNVVSLSNHKLRASPTRRRVGLAARRSAGRERPALPLETAVELNKEELALHLRLRPVDQGAQV